MDSNASYAWASSSKVATTTDSSHAASSIVDDDASRKHIGSLSPMQIRSPAIVMRAFESEYDMMASSLFVGK